MYFTTVDKPQCESARNVQKISPPSLYSPPYMANPQPPLYLFYETPLTFHFWLHFFRHYRPNKIRWKRKNKFMRESYFFVFRRAFLLLDPYITNENQFLPLPFYGRLPSYMVQPYHFYKNILSYYPLLWFFQKSQPPTPPLPHPPIK